MKKAFIVLILSITTICVIAQNIGESFTKIYENNGTASCTNYFGMARVTENTVGTANTNDAVWWISRTILDANGDPLEIKLAYGNGTGDNVLWSTAWTNRANAVYK